MTDEVVEYLPVLGPWRAGYRRDPTVVVYAPSLGGVPCTPGTASALYFMLTGEWPGDLKATAIAPVAGENVGMVSENTGRDNAADEPSDSKAP